MGSPSGRGRFGGTDHLTTEAVVAYVDGELSVGAHQRASGHLAGCEQCTLEVHAQQQARAALRTADPLTMPSSLLGALCSIPDAATAGTPLSLDVSVRAGSVVFSAHSGYVAVLRPDAYDGDLPPESADSAPPSDRSRGARGHHRRILPFVVVVVSVTVGALTATSHEPVRTRPDLAAADQVQAAAGPADADFTVLRAS